MMDARINARFDITRPASSTLDATWLAVISTLMVSV
jgi:hypothetical protein